MHLLNEMTPEAFTSLILPLKHKLFRYAKSILGNADEAKDVVQETLLKVWEKRSEIHQYKSMEAWCMTLTRNFALGKFRAKEHKNTCLDGVTHTIAPLPTADQYLEWKDTFQQIETIVGALSLKQKEVFQLRDVEGYAYQEISEITGYALEDVKVSLYERRTDPFNTYSLGMKQRCKQISLVGSESGHPCPRMPNRMRFPAGTEAIAIARLRPSDGDPVRLTISGRTFLFALSIASVLNISFKIAYS